MMWRVRHPAHYVAGLVTVAGALVGGMDDPHLGQPIWGGFIDIGGLPNGRKTNPLAAGISSHKIDRKSVV